MLIIAPSDISSIPGLAISGVVIFTNLLFFFFILSGYWFNIAAVTIIVIDAAVVASTVVLLGPSYTWLSLIPVATASAFFGWIPGLGVGLVMGLGFAGWSFIRGTLDAQTAALALLALPAVGALTDLLNRDENELARVRQSGRQARQATKIANEYLQVIYEMAEILSLSKLNPARVLISAVDFGLEGLERVGVEQPLYGAIMLFDSPAKGLDPVLRISYASSRIPPSAKETELPGQTGAIGEAFEASKPVVCDDPPQDPELKKLTSFQDCKTVLCLPLAAGDDIYGIYLIGADKAKAFRKMHIELMAAVSNQTAASLNNAQMYSSLLAQRNRIANIEKSARAQLASELHDGPTQGVSAIAMRVNYIRKLIEKKPEIAGNELYQIEDMARRTAEEMRAMLFELRPKSLDEGLEAGLNQLAAKNRNTFKQNVAIQVDESADRMLDDQTKTTLFSIAVESINNARKHANAEMIVVSLRKDGDTLIYEVRDNGDGFDVDKALEEAKHREGHLGLLNLYERAALIEGTMHITSEPSEGTSITVLVPVELVQMRKQEEQQRQWAEERDLI